jgi:hypothetical protein
VILPAIEFRWIRDFDQLAIDIRANEALLANRLEEIAEFSLPSLNEWCTDLDARAFRPGKYDLGNLPSALTLHGSATGAFP